MDVRRDEELSPEEFVFSVSKSLVYIPRQHNPEMSIRTGHVYLLVL
jgi:hypothetical protein